MNDITTYGLDLAKQVFQVHWVDVRSGEIQRKTLRRAQVSTFFARAPRGVVAMEACGSAHHWARQLQSLGHEVKLIAAQFVRPFVKTNKTDAADAQAIWEAVQRPDMRFVAVKREQQQAVLSLHRLRAQWVKIRTLQANQIRGLLYEFGVVVPLGWRALLNADLLTATDGPVPTLLRSELIEQLEALRAATARITALDRRIDSWQRAETECRRIAAMPGVGPLIASAVVASVADARQFRSARQFAAYLGLVPSQSGTGGRVKLLGISKRGDTYLRTLLIHGARSVLLSHSRHRRDGPLHRWLAELLKRRPSNVVVVALANKMARTIWALLAHRRTFDAAWNRAVTH